MKLKYLLIKKNFLILLTDKKPIIINILNGLLQVNVTLQLELLTKILILIKKVRIL